MHDLVDDLSRQHLQSLALLGSDRSQLAQRFLQLRGSNGLQALLQLDDRGHRILGQQPSPEVIDLAVHDLLGLLGLLKPLLSIAIDDLLQIVDVVEVGAANLSDCRIEITRH